MNWGKLGDRYMHGFGTIGQEMWTVRFDQYWQKYNMQGKRRQTRKEYSITRMASKKNKFMPADLSVPNRRSIKLPTLITLTPACTPSTRKFSEARGVIRTEGKINQSGAKEGDGFIEAVIL